MRMLLFFSDGEPVLLAAAGTSAGTVSYWAVGAGVVGGGYSKGRQNPNLRWKELLALGIKMTL